MPYKSIEAGLANKRERYTRDEFPKLRRLKYHLKHMFGLDYQDFNAMIELQAGKCALCRKEELGKYQGKRLAVDHDPFSGKVRGLLCSICNTSMRQIDNVPNWAKLAMVYKG